MNKISFDTAKILWDNLNTIESSLLGYKTEPDLNQLIEKIKKNKATEKKDTPLFSNTSNTLQNKAEKNTLPINQEKNYSPNTFSTQNNSVFYTKLQECKRCSLHLSRKQAIEGRGVKNPLVLIITEAPTEKDDIAGTLMTGEAGELLEKMLSAISLFDTENCYITPIVKCKPPENKLPLLEQMYACKNFLDIQIQKMKPSFILALGSVTSLCLFGPKQSFQTIRGKVFDYKPSNIQENTVPLLISYSPHSLLHDVSLKGPAWQDLKRVRRVLDDIEGKKK